jgi:hypothetical protein
MLLKEKEFELVSEGIHSLTITEVEDLGMVETTYKGQTRTSPRLRIQITANDQKDKEGKPVSLNMFATQSLGTKSTLGKFLRNLLGDSFNPKSFETDDLIGYKFQAVVDHNTSDTTGKTYANIGSILKNRKPAVTTSEEF